METPVLSAVDHVIFTVLTILSLVMMWMYIGGARRKDANDDSHKGAVGQMIFAFGIGVLLSFTVVSVAAGVSPLWIVVGIVLLSVWAGLLAWKYPRRNKTSQ